VIARNSSTLCILDLFEVLPADRTKSEKGTGSFSTDPLRGASQGKAGTLSLAILQKKL
jgi:hypothetical protein